MAETAASHSVRLRLLVIALLPMLILMPLLIGVTTQRWSWRTDQILAARVASDLTVAQQYLSHLIDSTALQMQALAGSAALRDQLAASPGAPLSPAGPGLELDFLVLIDGAGRLIAASPGAGLPPAESALIAAARAGRSAGGIEVLDADELMALSASLAERARIPLIDTAASAPEARHAEDRGLVILAAAPFPLPGSPSAVLAGGILLNRNEGFVDRINDLVYPATDPGVGGDTDGFDHGITTLFLGDTRIATTLRAGDGERALGTRASAEVRERLLEAGGSWRDTAFVVNDWYISAYDAITDSRGRRVGMLYTGFPKAPHVAARRITWAFTGAVFLAVAALSVPLFLHWARGIFRPLGAMGDTISRVETGDLGARTGPQPGADEITHLARHLDRLLDLLQQRDRELNALNEDLNARVEQRTAELSHANLALKAATRQLVLSEKLATIGEVTAGVAHEINNPLAVIQGNLEVLRMILADRMDEAGHELNLIEEQIRRMEALSRQLLQFARPEEFEDGPSPTDPGAVAAGIRPLVQHLLAPGRIALETDIRSSRAIRMNADELRQILVNLTVNAIQAMPDGGTVRLVCEDAASSDGRDGVRITLRDTGAGMDEATLARIFDPFFTTRGAAGSGLGLSICQTLVNRQDGEMQARSISGAGSTFIVWLPGAAGDI